MKFADLTKPQQKLAVALASFADVVESKGVVSRQRLLEIYEEVKDTELKFGYPLWVQKPEFRAGRGEYKIPLPTEKMIESFNTKKTNPSAKKKEATDEAPKKRGRPVGSGKQVKEGVENVKRVKHTTQTPSFSMDDMKDMVKMIVSEVITQAVPVIVREVMQHTSANVQPVEDEHYEEIEMEDEEIDLDNVDNYESEDDVSLDDILAEAGIR